MIIDAHAHACGAFLKGRDIIDTLNKHKVDKIVLVPGELGSDKNYSLPRLGSWFPNTDVVLFTNWVTKIVIGLKGVAAKIDAGNAYVHSLAQEYPERIIQFYWVRLSVTDALENLDRYYKEYGFKGVKIHQCWESFKVNSDKFHQLAEWAGSKSLPVFAHLYSKRQASRLAKYIKSHNKTVFIIAHLFGLERYIEEGLNSDNVFFEISQPQLISVTRLTKAINQFGAGRILMGSDTPYGLNNLEINIKRIQDLPITEEEKELILGNNLKALLGTKKGGKRGQVYV